MPEVQNAFVLLAVTAAMLAVTAPAGAETKHHKTPSHLPSNAYMPNGDYDEAVHFGKLVCNSSQFVQTAVALFRAPQTTNQGNAEPEGLITLVSFQLRAHFVDVAKVKVDPVLVHKSGSVLAQIFVKRQISLDEFFSLLNNNDGNSSDMEILQAAANAAINCGIIPSNMLSPSAPSRAAPAGYGIG